MSNYEVIKDRGGDILERLPRGYSVDFDLDPMITIDPSFLLHLKVIDHPDTEFGFVLRHYWNPASILSFQQCLLIKQGAHCEDSDLVRASVTRHLVRCEANCCVWREETVPVIDGSSDRYFGKTRASEERLCFYDCCEQAYWTRDVLSSETSLPKNLAKAQSQALYAIPFIVPPGPVPLGFKWHDRVGNDAMDYELVSSEMLGDMTVLFIRRHGRYTVLIPEGDAFCSITTEREGLTAFALQRSVILEDRFVDRVIEASPELGSCVNARSLGVTRLVQSCTRNESDSEVCATS